MNNYALIQNYSDDTPHQESLKGMLGSGRLNINKAINGGLFPSLTINEVHILNDTDGDGVPYIHPGVKTPEEGWDIDADGDNIYDEDDPELILKGVPFSLSDNKSSVTGLAFDVGYPLLKSKVFSLDVYTEFNFLNFPETMIL